MPPFLDGWNAAYRGEGMNNSNLLGGRVTVRFSLCLGRFNIFKRGCLCVASCNHV